MLIILMLVRYFGGDHHDDDHRIGGDHDDDDHCHASISGQCIATSRHQSLNLLPPYA